MSEKITRAEVEKVWRILQQSGLIYAIKELRQFGPYISLREAKDCIESARDANSVQPILRFLSANNIYDCAPVAIRLSFGNESFIEYNVREQTIRSSNVPTEVMTSFLSRMEEIAKIADTGIL